MSGGPRFPTEVGSLAGWSFKEVVDLTFRRNLSPKLDIRLSFGGLEVGRGLSSYGRPIEFVETSSMLSTFLNALLSRRSNGLGRSTLGLAE